MTGPFKPFFNEKLKTIKTNRNIYCSHIIFKAFSIELYSMFVHYQSTLRCTSRSYAKLENESTDKYKPKIKNIHRNMQIATYLYLKTKTLNA